MADTFKGQFECLGENTEKYITFSLPIKKEVEEEEAADGKEGNSKKKQDHSKKEEDDNSKKKKKITYKLKFNDSHRFMQSKLLDLVKNLSGIFNMECIRCIARKKIK